MKRILLTGATGFIGSNILKDFQKDNQIFILVRKKIKPKNFFHKNIFSVKFSNYVDLNRKLKKLKIDLVFHCATHYTKQHKYSDIDKFISSNILLGNIILENLIFMKVKKFINFSTVWQDPYPVSDDFQNLYAVYKSDFSKIVKFYKKRLPKIRFYEIILTDTFGLDDNRDKLITTIKKNFKANKFTKIISKNLYLNLINITDIINGLRMIIKNKTQPGQYVFKNLYDLKVYDLIKKFNHSSKRKLKVKWLSNQVIKKKIFKYNQLNFWKVNESSINDIINYIKK
jgi:nucleoside-diphosphate-sugar epimerase